jgi:hypothetical protein
MRLLNVIRYSVLGIFFLSLVVVAYLPSEMIFNSPDESANALFAWQFSNENILSFVSKFSGAWSDIVHPRSMLVINDLIVPIGFVGFPIMCGLLAKIFGNWFILLFTPLIATFAVFAWRKLILFIYKNESIADLSALFLLIHPAFWYYCSRTLMPNAGFVSLLIISLYLFICDPFKNYFNKKRVSEILSGLCVGIALTFRASEVIWIVLIITFLFVYYRKKINSKQIVLFVAGIVMLILPFLYINNSLYGSPITTGYTVGVDQLEVSNVASIDEQVTGVASLVFDFVFPFGIHEMNIIRNVWNYVFVLYPWMSLLAICGALIMLRDRKWKVLLVILCFLFAWLSLVYGSWNFHDNPDALVITLGNSYVRYWIPIFVISSVLTACFIEKVTLFLNKKKKWLGTAVKYFAIAIMAYLSIQLVVFGSDGFVSTIKSINSFAYKKQIVLENTPADSIIIADMADKYLFPQRQVIFSLRDERVYEAIIPMLDIAQVYYFGITIPETDIKYLESVIFNDKVELLPVVTVNDETLYQFIYLNNE